jgi:hypothetical protein
MRGLARVHLLARQRGAALLILLALVSVILLYAVVTGLNRSAAGMGQARAQNTATALAQARDALIGYAVSQTAQPGILPCPDTDNDGSADSPCEAIDVTAIGRLPWKTLGLPDLRDGSGECLWYAVSANFKNSGTSGPSVVNSDSSGTLIVKDGTGADLLSPPNLAIAIVFAPGKILSSQSQDRTPPVGSTAVCGGNNAAANYLEGTNASAGTTYVTTSDSDTFNDRLLLVASADVITPVERRAAKEILQILADYRSGSSCNCYPWADFSDGASNAGDNYGRVPLLGALPDSWASRSITVPPWLTTNQWWWVFFYTIAPSETASHGAGTLAVDGVSGKSVVLITSGPAGGTRPAGSPGTWDNNWWGFYVDDSNNSDMGSNFITPSSTAYARDRIYTIP